MAGCVYHFHSALVFFLFVAGIPAGGIQTVDQEMAQLQALAAKLGQTVRPESESLAELGGEIAVRMTPRVGDNVFQMPAPILHCFPRELLVKLLPGDSMQPETLSQDWMLDTVTLLSASMPQVLSVSGYVCAGLTKVLRVQSEPVIRMVAVLMPNMQIQHVCARGTSRTYINFAYALVSQHGEFTWPKTKDRREVAVHPETERELREHVLSDMLALGNRGEPLSPGWWRQLGNEVKAQEVEEMLANPIARRRPQPRAASAPRLKKAKAVKQLRATKESYEIDCILAEQKVYTKEKKIYLVRWCGYDPTWEGARASGNIGEAVETWEPLYILQGTQALQRWQEQ